ELRASMEALSVRLQAQEDVVQQLRSERQQLQQELQQARRAPRVEPAPPPAPPLGGEIDTRVIGNLRGAVMNEVFESWRQVVLEWEPKLRNQFVGLRIQAMTYKFTGNINSALVAFENLVWDYESQSDNDIDDDEKIGT
ncbi:unnamed protein product, partial [Prorocentrum cordatum]